MADRPLRPATRRSLGEPLPHQLADRPRAPPEASACIRHRHFLTGPCDLVGVSGISTGFPVLSRSSGQVAHVLLTRSPLGLLRCFHRMDLVRLACIRHAASVRPEPGSNSPSRLLPWPRKTPAKIREPIGMDSSSRIDSRLHRIPKDPAPPAIALFLTYGSRAPKHPRAARTGFWLSLFRFQGTTGHAPWRRRCRTFARLQRAALPCRGGPRWPFAAGTLL